jgi:methionine-rich copper-binding protein CopC
MKKILAVIAVGASFVLVSQAASAHAFLDHASPAVGSSASAAPTAVTLWFTQDLEPAFSTVTVTDKAGQRVDLDNAQVPPGQPAELQVGLKKLPPGTYKVQWRVVSVDTHKTEGHFTFDVRGG